MSDTPFEPSEFLTLARSLAKDSTDEAALRTAVGRAYYGVFLLLRDRFGVVQTEGVHAEVRYRLKRYDSDLGDSFDSLLKLRRAADYEMLPEQERDRDWAVNWQRVENILRTLEPGIARIRR
jgi:hypothetical protein